MPFLDFFVWVLGVCGLAHFFVIKNEMQDDIFWKHRNYPNSKFYFCAEKIASLKLFTCPACLALCFSSIFVHFYFNSEILLTKIFICFTTYIIALLTLRVLNAD